MHHELRPGPDRDKRPDAVRGRGRRSVAVARLLPLLALALAACGGGDPAGPEVALVVTTDRDRYAAPHPEVEPEPVTVIVRNGGRTRLAVERCVPPWAPGAPPFPVGLRIERRLADGSWERKSLVGDPCPTGREDATHDDVLLGPGEERELVRFVTGQTGQYRVRVAFRRADAPPPAADSARSAVYTVH